ncbi:undecaprenyldiphospho-muramoylpentapeptide beta-N-acetylglucosaminyltransferase [Massilioclostridium coli]|uniref:undecaprenyldiphospho-muramoylpentapeptide beta-N-acetylglucosaminyltransferase n=1 Tax=Massilioclostridium coli TaxID=1870991 RepID=UPI0022E23C40|nr:undecaprenyldiphospho-muramoylpentapeptide beta-N-acetylglucosaminyltransferase [Massilioclostridium coli]
MKVLLAAGGTAGHINPAIAIADTIQKQDPSAKILFAGTPNGMESTLVPKAGYHFVPIKVRGFQRKLTLKNIARNIDAVKCLMTSDFVASKIIKEFQPDLVIGTGGYVSGPIVRKAAQKGIKTAIHEQNAYPGVTNKMLSKQVDLVMLAVEEAKKMFPQQANMVITGNPIRESILSTTKEEARKELGMDDEMCILSFGGSLGAVKVNEIAADIMQWHNKKKKVNHIHACGRLGKDIFPQMLKERHVDLNGNPRIDVRDYIHNMDTCLAAADLVICRAGAITLSELEATGKASILIPSPNVAENHQYHNAMVLQNHGAAVVVEEKNYDAKEMVALVNGFYEDRDKLRRFSKSASKLAILDTSDRIYNALQEIMQ